MAGKILRLIGVLVMLTVACSSILTSATAPPVYYQLSYSPPDLSAEDCPNRFHKGVRVWTFGSAAPYDRTEMVVLAENGEVLYSGRNRWVAEPGTLLAESLIRDLNFSFLFPQVISASTPLPVPLILTGRVYAFAWQKRKSGNRAVLQVEVSLTGAAAAAKESFHKVYTLQSGPFAEDSAAVFADAMSALASDFSKRLQADLCCRIQPLPARP